MQRPPSIITFERLYLGSFVLWAINAALFWSRNQELMTQKSQMQSNPQMAAMVGPIMIASLVITAALTLLFWFLVARQRSLVGKWLVVVTEALGVLFALYALLQLVRGQTPNPPMVGIGVVVTALAVAAAVMLFRPDAKAWLGEDMDDGVPPAQPLP